MIIITHDGRTIVVSPPLSLGQNIQKLQHVLQGILQGFDQTTNVILSDAIERIYILEEGFEEAPLGLYIVRGDNMSVR